MNTRRTFLTAAAAVVAASAVAGGARAAGTIKIGEINSYTRLPAFTQPYRNGWELAVEEINSAGGVLDRQLQVISRDDAGKPGDAVKIAEELVSRDRVVMLAGTFFSHIGLAVTDFANQKKVMFVAAEPLSDAVTWAKGNHYTFRLRPNTTMQAAMLAEEAAKLGLTRWATIAPNYKYGQDAVAAFKRELKKRQPGVEFVAEQWPALFKIDAAAESQALEAAKPDGIFNVTFGSDLTKFVREGTLRGVFKNRTVLGLLTGEPEYIDPLGAEAPKGWIVTGYPWYEIDTPAHRKFLNAYRAKYDDYPRIGSLVGYNTMLSIAAGIKKAGSVETEALVDAFEGLTFDSPVGPITYRAIDHQSTMGAYVGVTDLRDGKGVMVDWSYKNGADYLPPDDVVKTLRPGAS